ncbi:hypothetical protein M9Y10_008619 [Tritrichomonas musculus]|uniref:Uncharacterized protein n=1 Tax=Tritrichomonas musculus TaxID=1915356 RepID=A0ABR2IYL7_9EUKA
MESEPTFVDSNNNLKNEENNDSQKSNTKKVHIEQFNQNPTNNSTSIERVQSQPVLDNSYEIQRTPSTFVHVDSSEFAEDRIKTELSISNDAIQASEEKSSEYDAPIIDISEANGK